MRSPLVSVIIPAFRSASTLRDALQSLIKQTERRWEAIVVDDGSPDASSSIVERFAYFDERFRVTRQANAGPCAARNTGLKAATGRFVLFLDADDWVDPQGLSVMAEACQKHGWAAAYGKFRYARPDGSLTARVGGHSGGRPLFDALAESNVQGLPSSVLARLDVVRAVGGFVACLPYSCDWDMWGRLARRREGVGRVDACVSYYRMRPMSMGRHPPLLLRDALVTLRQMHASDPRVPSPDPRFANGADPALLPGRIAHFTVYAASLAVAEGEYESAVPLLDTIAEWPRLSPETTAAFLFYAICFARCEGAEAAPGFWPEVAPAVDRLLAEVERRSNTPGLSAAVYEQIGRYTDGKITGP
jgi:glycosyltransferase involved in cell wall biosynthesis